MTPPLPRVVAPAIRRDDLDALARRYARLPPDLAEARIAERANEAIAARRIDDAVFWQRVKFRARLLRAMGMGCDI